MQKHFTLHVTSHITSRITSHIALRIFAIMFVGLLTALLISLILAAPAAASITAVEQSIMTDYSNTYTYPNKELTVEEWKAKLNDTINNKLADTLQDESLSNHGKALKIASIIQDNLLYSPPESLLFDHYCLIQYLFAKQNMFIIIEMAENRRGDLVKFSQAMAMFNFQRGMADTCLDKLEKYLD